MNKQDKSMEVFKNFVIQLCKKPDELAFDYTGGSRSLITLTPNRADYGVLYGKQGVMKEALKVIASVMLRKFGSTCRELLLDEGQGERSERTPFTANTSWQSAQLERAFIEIGSEIFYGKINSECYRKSQSSHKMTLFIENNKPNKVLNHLLTFLHVFHLKQFDNPGETITKPEKIHALELVADCMGTAQGQRIFFDVEFMEKQE